MVSCRLFGKKRVWPNEGVIYILSGETEENQANAPSDSRVVPDEIQHQKRQNTSVERYRWANPPCETFFFTLNF
jgi:hypothetical protein